MTMNTGNMRQIIEELTEIRNFLEEAKNDEFEKSLGIAKDFDRLFRYIDFFRENEKFKKVIEDLYEAIQSYLRNICTLEAVIEELDNLIEEINTKEVKQVGDVALEIKTVCSDIAKTVINAGKEIGRIVKEDMPASKEKIEYLKGTPYRAEMKFKSKFRNWLMSDDNSNGQ